MRKLVTRPAAFAFGILMVLAGTAFGTPTGFNTIVLRSNATDTYTLEVRNTSAVRTFSVTPAGLVQTGTAACVTATGANDVCVNGDLDVTGTIGLGALTAASLTVTGATALNGDTTIGNAATDDLTLTAAVLGATPVCFDGATDDAAYTCFAMPNPAATRTVTYRDASGTVVISGDTLTGDVAATFDTDGSSVATVQADSVALTTDTTGNYVASTATGQGLTGGAAASEAAALTLTLDYSVALASAEGALAINTCVFADETEPGIICDDGDADTFEGRLAFGAVGADRTYTLPDRSGTVSLSGDTLAGDVTATLETDGSTATTISADAVALTTDTTGSYVTSVATSAVTGLTGGAAASEGATLTLALDYTATLVGNPQLAASGTVFASTGVLFEGATGGAGDAFEGLLMADDITVADRTWTLPNRSGTVALSGDTLTGDVTATLETDGSTATTIAADAVALGTDTTNNYVASIATDVLTGLTGGAAGSEGAAIALAFDYSQTIAGNPQLVGNAVVFGTNSIIFEGATGGAGNAFEIAIVPGADPGADVTLTLPTATGTLVGSGDTGTVTGTMIALNTITDVDIGNSVCTHPFSVTFNPTEAGATDDYVSLAAIDVATGDASFSAVEANEDQWRTPIAGVANNLNVIIDAAPGAGNDAWAITLRENAGSMTLTCTIDEAATTCTDIVNTPGLSTGGRLDVLVTSSGAAADPAAAAEMTISFCYGQ